MFHENWYIESQLQDLSMLLYRTKQLEGNIVEIGCWEGKSAVHLANHSYPENLICNDTWMGNIQESIVTGTEHVTEQILKQRDVYGIFVNNMNTLTKQNYSIVKEDCIEWLSSYDKPIKFIHIDASHEYESVFKTIQLALPKMVKNGVMCGDDFVSANMGRADLHGGVERAVRELLPTFRNIDNLWYYIKE
jgi:predicted O-methyltransferase YrrM